MGCAKRDQAEGLHEVRSFTGKQKPWDSYSTEGKQLSQAEDHEGNMPIHLAMHRGNWRIAQYVLDKHPNYMDPDHPSATDVERYKICLGYNLTNKYIKVNQS